MGDFGFGLVMGGSIGLGIGLVLVIGLVYLLSERLWGSVPLSSKP